MINSLIMSVVIDESYFEAKILHKMKEICGAISHKMDELIVRKHQVDRTWLLIHFYIQCLYFAILSLQ